MSKGSRSLRRHGGPAAQLGSSPMALAAAAAGGARRMEKCESAPGALHASGRSEVLGSRSRSGATCVAGERGGLQALGRIDPTCNDALRRGQLMEKHGCGYNCHCFLSKAAGNSEGCFGKLLLHARAGLLYYGWT